MKIISTLKKKLAKIKLIISDVDGVLTDGKIYLSRSDEIKAFSVKDGTRINAALRSGIKVFFITGRECRAVIRRSKEFKGVRLFFKERIGERPTLLLEKIKKEEKISSSEILYIGDDLNDLYIMSRVGVSVVPRDGASENKRVADIITQAKGGEGVVGEVIEMVMKEQKKWSDYVNIRARGV